MWLIHFPACLTLVQGPQRLLVWLATLQYFLLSHRYLGYKFLNWLYMTNISFGPTAVHLGMESNIFFSLLKVFNEDVFTRPQYMGLSGLCLSYIFGWS